MIKGTMRDLSDEELMACYQAGDYKAFEILYERHSGRVFEYLKKKVPVENARDLLQETFMRLHKSRDKYNSQYPFLPWLFTISRNALFDSFKKAEAKVINFSDSSPVLLENLAAVAIDSKVTQDFSTVLSELPDSQKRAIELRYMNEWSFEKISEDLKTSPDNVRKLISRGLKKARHLIGVKGDKE